MYELVNTSLPNGLIAGAHGFSTVAATKGMPDTLRMRVEAYCAYNHRVSAHDESYFEENPVNWFHAILPQGEHIVGRVAPAEFDYTGRTNRLARLFVFSKGKMPVIGGTAVLLKKARRLQEPWSGEARWLDDDKVTEGQLRTEPLSSTKDAPAWRKKFGDAEGLSYAKGFARLLAKNMKGGGKTIYFKTSAAHDVSGGELLYLFADLINLLPVEMRAGVAFSTYSAALPHGAICHLRGLYDSDRAFDMAKVTQPWVDCENNTVHNASMLPEEEIEPPKPMPKTSGCRADSAEYRPREMQYKGINPHLLERDKKHDPFIIGILIVIVIVVLVAIGIGVFLWMENNRKIRESGASAVLEAQRQEEEIKQFQSDEERKAEQEKERERQADNAAAEKQRQEMAEKDKRAKAEADEKRKKEEQERKRKEAEAYEKEKQKLQKAKASVAFIDAIKIEDKKWAEFDSSFGKRDKERLTNGVMRVFYYDDTGKLVNEPAGYVYNKTAKSFALRPKVESLKTSGMMYLWYDTHKKILYWDWSPLDKAKEGKWFESDDEVDLKGMCFGKTNAVFDTWTNRYKRTIFTITHGEKPFSCTTDMVVKVDFFKPDPREHEQKIKEAEKEQTEKDKALRQFDANFKEWVEMTNKVVRIALEHKNLKSVIDVKEREKKRAKTEKEKKRIQTDIDALETDRKIAIQVEKDPTKNKRKELREFTQKEFGIIMLSDDVITSITVCNKELMEKREKLVKALEDAQEKVGQATADKKDQDKNWRERIKQREFKVTKIEGVSR